MTKQQALRIAKDQAASLIAACARIREGDLWSGLEGCSEADLDRIQEGFEYIALHLLRTPSR